MDLQLLFLIRLCFYIVYVYYVVGLVYLLCITNALNYMV